MVAQSVTGYISRWNPTLVRKEWRANGRSTIINAGGSVTGPLVGTLTATPTNPLVSNVVTLTATASGGTAPYSYVFTEIQGSPVTLTGSGATRTYTATTSAVTPQFRVRITDSAASVNEFVVSVPVGTSQASVALYAGHIPNRVLIGIAGPENDAPTWADGFELIKVAAQAQLGSRGAGSYERRRFSPTNTNGTHAPELRAMLADGDADNQMNWVSFKVIGNDWAGVANGNYPAIPQMFRTVALERQAAGKRPFIAAVHHEPRGDGSLLAWSAMQIYMSNQLADINDILAWSCIGNGFLWNTVTGTTAAQTERTQMFPQSLINTYRINKHVVAVDTYDDHPIYTGQTSLPLSGTPVQKNRCSVKLLNWMNWMRARNCGGIGIGEWSVTDAVEMPKVWKVMRDNRDILGVTNYYNSIGGGSTWDWRMIPSTYQSRPSNPGVDYGGTPLTAGRLNQFPTVVAESTSAAYTGPVQ